MKMRGQITSDFWVILTLDYWNWRATFADKSVMTDKSRDTSFQYSLSYFRLSSETAQKFFYILSCHAC